MSTVFEFYYMFILDYRSLRGAYNEQIKFALVKQIIDLKNRKIASFFPL